MMQSLEEGIARLTLSASSKVGNGKLVPDAIRQLKNTEGLSIADIERVVSLKNEPGDDAMDSPSLLFLTNEVDRGTFIEGDESSRVTETATSNSAGGKTSLRKRKRNSSVSPIKMSSRPCSQKATRERPWSKKRRWTGRSQSAGL